MENEQAKVTALFMRSNKALEDIRKLVDRTSWESVDDLARCIDDVLFDFDGFAASIAEKT